MNKKVFISYSWGNKEHQDWIVNLGKRLMNDTVDVILDRWSLKDGQDIYSFMESAVKSEEVFRVLIISDKNYQGKADNRKGGVGTETQIISPELYSNEKQERFIPIVVERDDEGKAYLPIYLQSRKYIDFSHPEYFEDSYEDLLRNILETPSIAKPKLGTSPPSYITEYQGNFTIPNSKLRTLKNQFVNKLEIRQNTAQDFVDSLIEPLRELKPEENKAHDGTILINALKSYKPLREDYIEFVQMSTSYQNDFANEVFIDFFEKAPMFFMPLESDNRGSWSPSEFEIFQIIFHELFIYTIAIALKNKNYSFVSSMLHSSYFFYERFKRGNAPERFVKLYCSHGLLQDYYYKNFNMISGLGEYLISNLSGKLNKDELITADTLCYAVSCLCFPIGDRKWFPVSYLYIDSYGLPFFDRFQSIKHFERLKIIFDVKDENEMRDKLDDNVNKSDDRLSYGVMSHTSIPFVHELIIPQKLCTHP